MFGVIKRRFAWGGLAIGLAVLLAACGGGGGGSGATAVTYPVPTISDINGSATASGSSGSTFIIYGTGFNGIASGSPTAGYSINFLSGSSVAATASWAAGGWNSTYIKASVPNSGLTAGTTYNVTVTTPGGTSNAVSFLVTAGVTFSPANISWAQTASMPVATAGFATVVAPVSGVTAALTMGGNIAAATGSAASNVATVYLNTVNDGTGGTTAGTLNTWATTTPLPAARGFAAGAFANGYNSTVKGYGRVYVIGGLDSNGAAASSVYFASLSSDGSIPASGVAGTWAATTPLPAARYATGAAIFQGRLYVAGGADSTQTPTSTVWSAPINADGSMGAWSVEPALPVAIAYHQVVTLGGVLYTLGGTTTAALSPTTNAQSAGSTNNVYYSVINPANGALGNWANNTNNPIKAVEKNTVVAVGGYVLASGGLYNSASTGGNEEQYSQQSVNTLGPFNGATGSKTISGTVGGYNFYNHSAALYVDPTGKPHVLILGGGDVNTGALHSGVWYMP